MILGTTWQQGMGVESLATILPRTLQTLSQARSVSAMTTTDDPYDGLNDLPEATRLVGELISIFIDESPDDRVVEDTKELVHVILDNGYPPAGMMINANERRVWDLVSVLGFAPDQPWEAEQAIFGQIDEYDLFND